MARKMVVLLVVLLSVMFLAALPAAAHHCADQGGPIEGDCHAEQVTGPDAEQPDFDPDGDGLANEEDDCPNTYASTANGCPEEEQDSDGDGVPDSEDWCPSLASSGTRTGCPGESTTSDSDGDGVSDSEDNCPDVAGSAAAGGCVDWDNDGFLDGEDACPHLPGVAGGCPDTDGDGLNDSVDPCPTCPGDAPTTVVSAPVASHSTSSARDDQGSSSGDASTDEVAYTTTYAADAGIVSPDAALLTTPQTYAWATPSTSWRNTRRPVRRLGLARRGTR